MAAAPSPNPSAPTGHRRWLWLALGAALLLAAFYGFFRSGRAPGLSGADGDKRAAIELCWKEQANLKRGERLEGGACDNMERLFMPKIDAQAYGGA